MSYYTNIQSMLLSSLDEIGAMYEGHHLEFANTHTYRHTHTYAGTYTHTITDVEHTQAIKAITNVHQGWQSR